MFKKILSLFLICCAFPAVGMRQGVYASPDIFDHPDFESITCASDYVQDLPPKFLRALAKLHPGIMSEEVIRELEKAGLLTVYQGGSAFKENKKLTAYSSDDGIFFPAKSFKRKGNKIKDRRLPELMHETMHQGLRHSDKLISMETELKEFDTERFTVRVLYQMGYYKILLDYLLRKGVFAVLDFDYSCYTIGAFNGLASILSYDPEVKTVSPHKFCTIVRDQLVLNALVVLISDRGAIREETLKKRKKEFIRRANHIVFQKFPQRSYKSAKKHFDQIKIV